MPEESWWQKLEEDTGCQWKTVGGINLCIGKDGTIHNDGPSKGRKVGDLIRRVRGAEVDKVRDHPVFEMASLALRGGAYLLRCASNPVAEAAGLAAEWGVRIATKKASTRVDELRAKYGPTQANLILAGEHVAMAGLNAALNTFTAGLGGVALKASAQLAFRTKAGRALLAGPAVALTRVINHFNGTSATTQSWKDARSPEQSFHRLTGALIRHKKKIPSPDDEKPVRSAHPSDGQVITHSAHPIRLLDGRYAVRGNVNGANRIFPVHASEVKAYRQILKEHGRGSEQAKAHLAKTLHAHAHYHYHPHDPPDVPVYAKGDRFVSRGSGLNPLVDSDGAAQRRPRQSQTASSPASDRRVAKVHGFYDFGGPVHLKGDVDGQEVRTKLSSTDTAIANRLASEGKTDELDAHLRGQLLNAHSRGKMADFSLFDQEYATPLVCFVDKKKDAHATLTHGEMLHIGTRVWKELYEAYLEPFARDPVKFRQLVQQLKESEQ